MHPRPGESVADGTATGVVLLAVREKRDVEDLLRARATYGGRPRRSSGSACPLTAGRVACDTPDRIDDITLFARFRLPA